MNMENVEYICDYASDMTSTGYTRYKRKSRQSIEYSVHLTPRQHNIVIDTYDPAKDKYYKLRFLGASEMTDGGYCQNDGE